MVIRLRVLIYSTFILTIFSCKNSEKSNIEFKLINDTILSYNIDNYKENHSLLNIYAGKKKNILKFYLRNIGKSTCVLFLPISHESVDYNIGLENAIVQDEKGDTIKMKFRFIDGIISHTIEDWEMYSDSLSKIMYKNLGYKSYKIVENDLRKTIVLHPNEKVYFEYLFGLPINSSKDLTPFLYVPLKSNKEYSFQLYFECDTTNYKSYLTDSEIKTIDENKFNIYHGKLISNSIPIKFIE